MIPLSKSTIEEIKNDLISQAKIKVVMLREDETHPLLGGNKWWKLKYNLEAALNLKFEKLLTFGGSWSNHILATAAAAESFGFKSIGIIRGERSEPLNPILKFAHARGMQLHFVSREQYRKKTEPEFIAELRDRFGDFYLLPEGGTNELALKGTEELGIQIASGKFDYVCLPVGTGGTMAGIISGLRGEGRVIGFPVLKGGEFLHTEIVKLLRLLNQDFNNWELEPSYHFGGYARVDESLLDFIKTFQSENGILLEPVYTGKMMYGVYDLIRSGKFREGSTVMILHTGGVHRFNSN